MSLAIPGTVAASTSMGAIIPIQRLFGSNTSEIIQFVNIPQIYNHIYLTITMIPTGSCNIIMDNLPAVNLSSQTFLSGTANNSTAATSRSTSTNHFILQAPGITAPISNSNPSVIEVYILNYSSTTQFKPILIKHGNEKNTSGQVMFSVGNLNSLNPFTAFNLSTQVGGVFMSTNTTFSLYGIRGSDPR